MFRFKVELRKSKFEIEFGNQNLKHIFEIGVHKLKFGVVI